MLHLRGRVRSCFPLNCVNGPLQHSLQSLKIVSPPGLSSAPTAPAPTRGAAVNPDLIPSGDSQVSTISTVIAQPWYS